ncbi:MAG: helix-turn-helix transcriptional regulator, partial [Bacilli bacterium]|nr:helix-turn-helix transcriptional regulator [Bacilli bacterium]
MNYKISNKLKEILEKKNITPYKLVKDTGLDAKNIRSICRNEASGITYQTLLTLCIYLDCTPGE